jgi:hypothetical protein
MAVTPGQPFRWQDIVDEIVNSYPGYAFLTSPPIADQPLFFQPSGSPFPGYSGAVLIAMVCPPNLRALAFRADNGGYSTTPDFPQTVDPSFLPPSIFGIGPQFGPGEPLIAPNNWQVLYSAVYVGTTSPGGPGLADAIGDVEGQAATFEASNPTWIFLGTLVTGYSSNSYSDHKYRYGAVAIVVARTP